VADSTDRRESYRRDAIEGITLLASLEPDYVQQWIEDFAPDAPELLQAAYTGVASNDPEAFVREFSLSAGGQSIRREDYGAFHSAVMLWAETEPQEAMAFLNTEIDSPMTDGIREGIFYLWLRHDPETAMIEIESLLNDPTANEDSRMMLSQLYISEMTKADPESALRWALTQDNPMLQENAAMNVIFSWDPADTSGLQGFIDQLPPEQRDRLRVAGQLTRHT